ncbi:MAG: ABC transporter permease [Flavobacteriales bacterium]
MNLGSRAKLPLGIWYAKMAFRDARKSKGRLPLFGMAIVLGIAAIVSINGFRSDLERAMDREALTLLGADLEVEAYAPIDTSKLDFLESYELEEAKARHFASMVSIEGERKGTRLVLVQAIEKGFPFYGEIETEPAKADSNYRKKGGALVAEDLMTQFGLEVGDSIKVGKERFPIAGALLKLPGQNQLSSAIATPVVIPLKRSDETGLIQEGSRVEYKRYYRFKDRTVYRSEQKALEDSLRTSDIDFETVTEQKEETGKAFQNLTGYLNLVGFIALIMGCIGVASSVHIYMKEKTDSVAVLRCIGATQGSILRIFSLQIAMIGLIASLVGSLLGAFLQTWMPWIMKPVLPFTLSTSFSWITMGVGLGVGIFFAVLFALLPLLQVSGTSPMRALNSFSDPKGEGSPSPRWWIYSLIGLSVFLFALYQTASWIAALAFFGGTLFLLGTLLGIGTFLMRAARRIFSFRWSFPLRQGVANLFRPNGQTLVLVLAIGSASALVTTLLLVRSVLVERAKVTESKEAPNTILFDIQPSQKDSVIDFLDKEKMPVKQDVPIVPMRIRAIEGKDRASILADTTDKRDDHLVEREYRVSYRDTLIGTEEVVRGEWIGEVKKDEEAVPISVEKDVFQDLHLSLGDRIEFNVQGANVKTRVASVREIEWRKMQTNFLILFPKGVLENAPRTHAIMTRREASHNQDNLRYRLIQRFPNISVIDLERILESLRTVLDKIGFAIRFMGSFSIVTGLIILIGSLVLTKYQRMKESVLLRTLGAVKRDILIVQLVEYAALGTIASASGILLGLLLSWGLAFFWFQVPFVFPALSLSIVWGTALFLTVGLGILNARGPLREAPFSTLRKG